MKAGGGAAQPVGSLDSALAHALDLIEGQPALALEQATEILKTVPGHPIATLLVGMARRRDLAAAGALAPPGRLVRSPPQAGAARRQSGPARARAVPAAPRAGVLPRALAARPTRA